jgi:hypothetical protein
VFYIGGVFGFDGLKEVCNDTNEKLNGNVIEMFPKMKAVA